MMNKKGVSVLVFALVAFFSMAVLVISVWLIVESSSFDPYAGEDAATLSSTKYIGYKQQYFITEATRSFIKQDFTFSGLTSYMIDQGFPTSGNNPVMENELRSEQFYSLYEDMVYSYIEYTYNLAYSYYAQEYFDLLIHSVLLNDYKQSNIPINNQYYTVYIDEDNFYAFATQPIAAKMGGSSKYVYYPHVSIENSGIKDIVNELMLPVNIKTFFSGCILSSTIDNCKDRLSESSQKITSVIANEASDPDYVYLQATIDGVPFNYIFKKP